MTDTTDIELMHELIEIQAARAANWPDPTAPADRALEARHAERIAIIREQLSANRIEAGGTSEAPAGQEYDRGFGPAPAGNLLQRILTRIFR